jgi:hypothetical protein
MKDDTRYPYTYAADYVRTLLGMRKDATILSRSEASQIRHGIAAALGMEDEELAKKLADYYKLNEGKILAKAILQYDLFESGCSEPERISGNYMQAGARLPTRDGRKMGNALVTRVAKHPVLGEIAEVVTEAGNYMELTEKELAGLFYPPSHKV